MAGKMTVLDRLMKEGRIKPRLDETMWSHADFRDPLNYTFAGRQYIKAHPESFGRLDITPEREVYQKGIEARMQPKYLKADEDVNEAYDVMDAYKDEWGSAVDDAKEYMKEDWETSLDDQRFEDVDPYYMEVDAPSTNLRDYWPNDARTPDEIYSDFNAAQDRYYAAKDVQRGLRRPEAWMREQTITPRYRNYQRAMQQRAANRRMGHQLSRMWGDAYNRLRARGLSDDEARMYLHNYFGGR